MKEQQETDMQATAAPDTTTKSWASYSDDEKDEKDEQRVKELQHEIKKQKNENEIVKEKNEVLDSILNKSDMYLKRIELENEQRRLADENKRLAKEAEEKEWMTFQYNADDFYQLLRRPMFVVRDTEKNHTEAAFYVSDRPRSAPGEITVYWENERLKIRPANHAEYVLSMPAMYVVKRELEMKMNRRGGVLKPASELSVGRSNGIQTHELGPVVVKNQGARQIKVPYKPPSKKDRPSIGRKLPKNTNIKLKVSGGAPINKVKQKFKKRVSAGSNM